MLAALDEKRPGHVLTRDIERVLERSGEAPVYGPNLRASCRRLEDAVWLAAYPARPESAAGSGAGRHNVSGLPWGFCGTSRRQHMSAVME